MSNIIHTPHTWSEAEVVELIVKEIRSYRQDCRDRSRKATDDEMAQAIHGILGENFLLEYAP